MKRFALLFIIWAMPQFLFSQTDSSASQVDAEIWARNRKDAFRFTADDSLFVVNNSDAPFGYNIYDKTQDLGGLEFLIFSSVPRQVLGPVYSNGMAILFKVVRYDSSYRSRLSHVFLPVKGKSNKDTLAAIKQAEKYLAEALSGKDFGQIVKSYSKDSLSAASGGDLGWFWHGKAPLPGMNDFLKNATKAGDMRVFTSSDGVHLVRITELKVRDRFRAILIPLVKKL
jgi:peptidyl-prolyl cis-trans isomerase D